MKLVYKSDGAEVSIGAVLKNGVEQAWVLESSQRPQHAASSGRIYVRSLEEPEYKRELFPHVLGLEFVEDSSNLTPKEEAFRDRLMSDLKDAETEHIRAIEDRSAVAMFSSSSKWRQVKNTILSFDLILSDIDYSDNPVWEMTIDDRRLAEIIEQDGE